jgi:hypothetical protein
MSHPRRCDRRVLLWPNSTWRVSLGLGLLIAFANGHLQTVGAELDHMATGPGVRQPWLGDIENRARRLRTAAVEYEQEVVTFPGEESDEPIGRYGERVSMQWDDGKLLIVIQNSKLRHVRRVCAFDGRLYQMLVEGALLFDGVSTRPTYSSGIIREAGYSGCVTEIEFQPLLLAIQPFHRQLGRIDLASVRELSKKPTLDGRILVALEVRTSRSSPTHHELWLDPERNHALVRIFTVTKGHILRQSDITHRDVPGEGYLPQHWTIHDLREDGSLWRQVSATIQQWDITGLLEASDFGVQFPAGSVVTDMRTEEDYVVTPGGGRRLILPHETNATYEQWVRTESGQAHGAARGRWPYYWAIAGGVVCTLFTAAILAGIVRRRGGRLSYRGRPPP